MKISQSEKEKNRRKLIEAAVEIIGEKGFRGATMREIARRAGLADATIYKYFPDKQSIVFGYFEVRFDELTEHLKSISDFNKYDFSEQMQTVFESELELMMGDRDFLKPAMRAVAITGLHRAYNDSKPARTTFLAITNDILDASIEAGEFQDPPARHFVGQVVWDFNMGLLHYWLNDRSENFENTTQLIHKSLDVFCECLRSQVLHKVLDLGYFFVRQHLLSFLNKCPEKPSTTEKRPFMQHARENKRGRQRR